MNPASTLGNSRADHGPPRYATGEAEDRLSTLLNLRQDPYMQDWDLEVSDPDRLAEFCTVYETSEFDASTKFTLMGLIVASLDGWLQLPDTGEWDVSQQVERLLRRDFLLHLHTLNRWRLGDEPDPENVFRATPVIRHIWQEWYKQEYGRWLEDDTEDDSPESDGLDSPAPP
jgi:hypothetical protein